MSKHRKSNQAAVVYVGYGTSHSWTWFADIFDKAGFYSVSFLNEKDIINGGLDNCDVFFISGGDTFAIAEGLGREGAEAIENYVKNGGIYIGSCAGAYLPLKSSLPPLNMFNFVNARITNLTKNLPVPVKRAEKFCTEYGCRYVFHPVRGEVLLQLKGSNNAKEGTIKAPLYGGPAIFQSEDIETLAEYAGFTEKTEFLIDRSFSQQTIIGHVAAGRKKFGDGIFYLFGPHFEHPEHHDANRFLFNILSKEGLSIHAFNCRGNMDVFDDTSSSKKKAFIRFLSEISNARIVALSLERTSYKWLLGKKVYEPEKIRVFLETIWKRAKLFLSKEWYQHITADEIDLLSNFSREITARLKQLQKEAISSLESDNAAALLFFILREATAKFLSVYFRLRRDILTEKERGSQCTYISRQQQLFIH